MRKMKLRVNQKQLQLLSKDETSGNFQKEGMLGVGREVKCRTDLNERFCRLRGNMLFILKEQGGKPEEVLLLERCDVTKLPGHDTQLAVTFESGDPPVFLQCSSPSECASWLFVLKSANTDSLRRRITHLRTLVHKHTHSKPQHSHETPQNLGKTGAASGAKPAAKVSPLHLTLRESNTHVILQHTEFLHTLRSVPVLSPQVCAPRRQESRFRCL